MSTKSWQAHIKSFTDQINKTWDESITPELINYIKIPNKSPAYDPQWKAHGYMHQAMNLLIDWCKKQPIKNMKIELIEEGERTPLLYIEIPGQLDETIVLYGHMDKQPEMTGWHEGLGPWQPVLKNDKLYGRGSSDDGYAIFASLNAIATLQQHKIPHARCVVLIEACEESGSVDLPFYLDYLKKQIGKPSLVICLDSEAGNYEQLWMTSSLRGLAGGELKIEVLAEGMHSGASGGVVPSPFMILRQLLDRVENIKTNKVLLKDMQVTIPKHYLVEARHAAKSYGKQFMEMFHFLPGVKPTTSPLIELLLNRTWRAQLAVTGIAGLPLPANAGNVTIPHLSVELSMRLPPTCDAKKALKALKTVLEKNPPFGAKISFTDNNLADGCAIPQPQPWLENAIQAASSSFFGKKAAYHGCGGSIPFIRMLNKRYQKAEFVITGVLGPKSNAHGPNEFLHLPTAKKITGCVAAIIAAHYEQYS